MLFVSCGFLLAISVSYNDAFFDSPPIGLKHPAEVSADLREV